MGLDAILRERYKHDKTHDRHDKAEKLIMATRIFTVKSLKVAKVRVADNLAGDYKPQPYHLVRHDDHLTVYVDAEVSVETMEVELAREMALWLAKRLRLRSEMLLQNIILIDPSRIEALMMREGFAMRPDGKEYFSTFLGAQTIKHQVPKIRNMVKDNVNVQFGLIFLMQEWFGLDNNAIGLHSLVCVQEVTDRPEETIFTVGKVDAVTEDEKKVRNKKFRGLPLRTLSS